MLEGFSLGNYLLLVDFTARLFREGKAVVSAEVTGILDRLGSSAHRWQARLENLKGGRLLGRFFAASRDRLREVAAQLKVHHLRGEQDQRDGEKEEQKGSRAHHWEKDIPRLADLL